MKLIRRRSGRHESQSTSDGVTTTTTDSYNDSDTFSQFARKFSRATRWQTAAIGVLGVGLTIALWQWEQDREDFRHELCVDDVEDDLDDRALWFAIMDEAGSDQETVQIITLVLDDKKPLVDIDDECG